ncbi:long-chain fatty acid--CoA ligase [Curtobacterium sp. MCPF17_052]|uniref:AMP-dependent synthetase/ligase n=1 Tax=Curtobacterium sp. MCPF17_052 TaxID=2175655 RepID=UPI0024DF3D46|nr:AMP-binding protein [Curtobacterium sp. MCPF17_052]WIB12385.1 AMP-binding protein [Curtobacterium sp. MCPF17_052]
MTPARSPPTTAPPPACCPTAHGSPPARPILAERTGDTWTGIAAADVLARVRAIAKGFVAAGLQPGAHVAILSRTRMEWTLVDFAVWTAGLVSVPVYETSSPDQIRHILSDSESVAIVVEKEEHARRVAGITPDLPHLGQHWTIDGGGLDDLARLGEEIADDELDARTAAVSGRDDATIIYTSGTTGRPKGCVLRHDNFTATVEGSTEAMSEIVAGDASTLLFIPMAHVFARFIAAMSVSAGVLVGHEPDTKDLMRAVSTFKPTFLLAVPPGVREDLQLGRAEGRPRRQGARLPRRRRHRRRALRGRGRRTGPARARPAVPAVRPARLQQAPRRDRRPCPVRHQRFRAALPRGCRTSSARSACTSSRATGSPRRPPPATVNRATELRIGSVGRALPGVEVRIADDQEILIRGVDVFDRYWKNPDATAAAFRDGWFRTGDLGRLDGDGILSVTGRAKELIVTASGKNVAPAPLEDAIREHPIVGQVVVVGEGKPFVAALVTLDREMLPGWCEARGIAPALSPPAGGARRAGAAGRPGGRGHRERTGVPCRVGPVLLGRRRGPDGGLRTPHTEAHDQAFGRPPGLRRGHRVHLLGLEGADHGDAGGAVATTALSLWHRATGTGRTAWRPATRPSDGWRASSAWPVRPVADGPTSRSDRRGGRTDQACGASGGVDRVEDRGRCGARRDLLGAAVGAGAVRAELVVLECHRARPGRVGTAGG